MVGFWEPMIRLLCLGGNYTESDLEATRFVAIFYGAGIPAFCAIKMLLPVFYARRTTLAAAPPSEQRHVAVCEDCVHVESEAGPIGDFDLSDLRTVRYTDEHLVAGFGSRRYVYVPRRALSEGRYRKLAAFLSEHSRH